MTPIIAALGLLLTAQAETTHERQFHIEMNIFAVKDAQLPDQPASLPFPLDTEHGAPIIDDPAIDVSVLSRPRMAIHAGSEARLLIGQGPIQYLERLDHDTFKLQSMPPSSINLLVKLLDNAEQPHHVLFRTKMNIRHVTGRTPIEGIDLPIGQPIIHTLDDEFEATIALGEWHSHVFPAVENRHLVITYRITDPDAPQIPVEQAYTVQTQIIRMSATNWTDLLAGLDASCAEAFVALTAFMPTAEHHDPAAAEPLPNPGNGTLVTVDAPCILLITTLAEQKTSVHLDSSSRVTWSPARTWFEVPGEGPTLTETLFKVVITNRDPRAGFGTGGTPSSPITSGEMTLTPLFDFLKTAAPNLWNLFDVTRDSYRPVIVADITTHDTATPRFDGHFLVYRIENPATPAMTLKQARYFRIKDYDTRRGYFARAPNLAASGITIHEGTGQTPIQPGQTALAAYRMPISQDVILTIATLNKAPTRYHQSPQ